MKMNINTYNMKKMLQDWSEGTTNFCKKLVEALVIYQKIFVQGSHAEVLFFFELLHKYLATPLFCIFFILNMAPILTQKQRMSVVLYETQLQVPHHYNEQVILHLV